MILHIPHSSEIIPEELRDQIILSDDELCAELKLMTDAFTDELFALPEGTLLRFPISRLLVDVERFPDDTEEPMSKVGMGMIYTHSASGKRLKRTLQPEERRNLVSRYEAHHQAILKAVNIELEKHGKALIIDCHSFPSHPLPCDSNQSTPRPDFCIGTDHFHTPNDLLAVTAHNIKKMGYTLKVNQPYSGTMVPMAFYGKDRRVRSIMIEVNRSLYMDGQTGVKSNSFNSIKREIQSLLSVIKRFQHQN